MRLHEDSEAFLYAVGLASRSGIRQQFLEKDYWVTFALNNLAESTFGNDVAFKGGTSLSKCYGLIERFSEDVDLAIVRPHSLGSSQKKALIKKVESAVSKGLQVRHDPAGSKKSGMRRTTMYDFSQIVGQPGGGPTSEYLKLEITAYSKAHPTQMMEVESYLGKALREDGRSDLVEEFHLRPFQVQVLCLERTFAEKVMALVKRSYEQDPIRSLREKIRHIYDLHQMLARRPDMTTFLHGDDFFSFLDQVVEDDRENRTSDPTWLDRPCGECCLFGSVDETWRGLESAYREEFSQLLFGDLPGPEAVQESLRQIGGRLRAYDARPKPPAGSK